MLKKRPRQETPRHGLLYRNNELMRSTNNPLYLSTLK